MSDHVAHESIWKSSDVIFGVTLLLGFALHLVPSVALTFPIPTAVRISVGVALVLAGVAIIVLAKHELKRAGQSSAPGKPTTQVVETGIYHFSRNPLYLGLVVVLGGLGLSMNIGWWAVLTLPMIFVLQRLLIIPEEQYLLGRFGEQYAAYMSRVRRWF